MTKLVEHELVSAMPGWARPDRRRAGVCSRGALGAR